MNEELIQKLVDQCVDKRERHGRTVEVLQSRKFAELIVRECTDLVQKYMTRWPEDCELTKQIKEHFGVEE